RNCLPPSFNGTMLLPFVTFMLNDFGIPELELGFYSGYMVAAFMAGQFLLSYFWGYLSDVCGRRPILLVGLTGSSLTCLAFGFAPSFGVALVLRFASGAINGIQRFKIFLMSCKPSSYLYEITDETNQGKGFSLLGMNRALGLIAGPAVGGFLCLPAQKYPYLFPPGSFFDCYPYALPCVFGFTISAAGTIAAFFVLKET
ncbi:major facilitator superfamily domain-containing protein, partial [Blyttiomyces helicus]